MSLRRYEILEELGQGKYGVVYRAIDKFMKDEVAVKITNDPTVPGFHDEAKSLQVISSATDVVPKFYESFNTDDGKLVLVMELIKGESPADMFNKIHNYQLLWTIIYHTLVAMIELHSTGYYHGDLHLGNLIWTGTRIRIIDLGMSVMAGKKINSSLTLEYQCLDVQWMADAIRDILHYFSYQTNSVDDGSRLKCKNLVSFIDSVSCTSVGNNHTRFASEVFEKYREIDGQNV